MPLALRVLAEVVVAAGRDAPQLLHAERVLEHDVRRALRIEREFRLRMIVLAEDGFGQADREQPVLAPLDPFAVALRPVGVLADEVFHLHLLEFAGAEDEVARRDLVAERFADLGDAERQLHAAGVDDVLEIDEHALRRLRTKISHR